MKTGEKIRTLRMLKGFSQENMAGMSRLAYGDIERGKTEPSEDRIAQIAENLGLTPNDIDAFGNTLSNFFDQCSNTSISANSGNHNIQNTHNYDNQVLQHQIEKLQIELKLCRTEKEKAEIEAKYWKEKNA